MTREEAIKEYIMPALKRTWNDDKCIEIISVIEQDPTCVVLKQMRAEIANHLQIMDICDVKKVNGAIVQSESVDRKVVLYDSVMQIIDKYIRESEVNE